MDLLDFLGEAAFYLFRAIIVGAPLLLWLWIVPGTPPSSAAA